MSYQIENGVSLPIVRRKPYGYYEKMLKSMSELEVNDPCAVKFTFGSLRECEQARGVIYWTNMRMSRACNYRYSVTLRRDENALYVRKVSR